MLSAINFTGIMYDDGSFTVQPSGTGIYETDTDYVDKAGGVAWATAQLNKYQDLTALVKAIRPNIKIGVNAKTRAFANAGDWNLYEYVNYAAGTGDQDNTLLSLSDSASAMTYDDYLPPDTTSGLMIYADTVDIFSSGAFWDRANRGPITMLSKHLIGSNPNTYFAYITQGGAYYDLIDDVYYLDPAKGTTLTQPLLIDASSNAKTISGSNFSNFPSGSMYVKIDGNPEVIYVTKVDNTTLTTTAKINFVHDNGSVIRFAEKKKQSDGNFYPVVNVWRYGTFFPAMAVNFGMPDITGNNGGARNLQWAKGVDYGWSNLLAYGSALNTNVWRRDFTNAVVLLRPNGGSSGVVDYATPSVPLDLGGTYYPLLADGTTGLAVTAISLRRDEGVILMKSPIQNDVMAPAAPSGMSVQ
jgi:hypothetical protein